MRRLWLFVTPSGKDPPHPSHPTPLAPFFPCLFRCLGFPSGLLGRRLGLFSQRTPCPHPRTPCTFPPFFPCLFLFPLFFLSGLLGWHPGSFSQCTPTPSPFPRQQKGARAEMMAFCVCSHLFPRKMHGRINQSRIQADRRRG